MSRLIDADELIHYLRDAYIGFYSEVQLAPYEVIDMIEEQPTAYDVDKVVKKAAELAKQKAEELMNKQFLEDECHMFSKGVQAMYLAYTENVKGGGIDGKVD